MHTTHVDSMATPAPIFPVETFVPVVDLRKDQALFELACLVDAAGRSEFHGVGHMYLSHDWMPPALRLADLFTLRLPPAVRHYTPTGATQAVAVWLRSLGTADEHQLGRAAGGAIAAMAKVAAAGFGAPTSLAQRAARPDDTPIGPGEYPPSVLARDFESLARERAHYGRIALYGYPVKLNDRCSICDEGLPVIHRGGYDYVCRPCDAVHVDCSRCGNPTHQDDLRSPAWADVHSEVPDLCESCAGSDDDGGDHE